MKKVCIVTILVFVVLCLAQVTFAAAWSSCDRWATWTNGGYTLYNNIWGSGAGWQCIWANNGSNWGVTCNHGSSGGVKSYPNSAKWVNRNANSVSTARTTFSVNRPGSGAYTTTFDVWGNGSAYEIMLWMNKQGAVGPIGSQQYSNQSIGGHTWNVYRGYNGSIQVFSFVRTSNTNSGTVDHKAIWNWLQSRGWWNNPYMNQVQFGFEITNTANQNAAFTCNSRSDSGY
ncbi:MAG TPA: hypothetical protein VIH42_10745 [Thermoguttaceae bacterium]